MNRKLRWYDYITINIYWFALTTRSQVLTPLILPLLVQRFVGEAVKGRYMGLLRLGSLMVALLIQALMGLLSDHSRLRWGRRRPFIVIGTVGDALIIALIAVVARMEGMSGYWSLFGLYILSMVASNTAHAATQGLIPDLVPEAKRGRFSGVKALLELPVPLVFTSFVVAGMVAQGNLMGALIALIVVLLVCMGITMFVPESRPERRAVPLDWTPLIRLLVMTVAFTGIILGSGAAVNLTMAWAVTLAPALEAVITVLIGTTGIALAVLVGVQVSVAVGLGHSAQRRRSFAWWVTNRLAFLVGSTNLAGFMLYFLQERFVNLSGEAAAGPAARVTMFVGLFIMVSALPSGWLADRIGRRPLVAIAGAVAAVGTALILLVPTMGILYVGGSLIGAAIGLFYSANWALGTDIVPQEEAGHYLGLSNLAGAGAGAIGAYIGGPIADDQGYTVLFTIYAIMFLISILALQGIRKETAATPALSTPVK